METKYEPIKFDSWQELAKYVIDGGEVYYDNLQVKFDGQKFNCWLESADLLAHLYTKKQPTLEELIAIKPRLIWVWSNLGTRSKEVKLVEDLGDLRDILNNWSNCRILTDDEIKQFLSGE